ncbi:hypothetical protein HPB47_011615 [Ixodes persulcatus]|uniref:Uncharacterized protein n=1 Tax=Ixodes persulcatus TaxID=34615 RepID=A0AC60NVT4_IXOPE|nr:hypothetical protein HPB47_011615 [Ixodes persulcatus]
MGFRGGAAFSFKSPRSTDCLKAGTPGFGSFLSPSPGRGLFDNADDEQEFAFRVAIDRINNDNGVLLRSRLLPHIERLDKDDSFRATKKGEPSIRRIFIASSVSAPMPLRVSHRGTFGRRGYV